MFLIFDGLLKPVGLLAVNINHVVLFMELLRRLSSYVYLLNYTKYLIPFVST